MRKFIRTISIIMLFLLFTTAVGCSVSPSADDDKTSPIATSHQKTGLIGYIVNDCGTMEAYLSMYGFLHTAQELNYKAKLYKITDFTDAQTALKSALDEGCDGVLLDCTIKDYNDAAQLALGANIPCITVFGENANISIDDTTHYNDIALLFVQQMQAADAKNGTILIYGKTRLDAIADKFKSAVNDTPYTIKILCRTQSAFSDARDELKEYLSANKNIRCIFAADTNCASPVISALKDLKRKKVTVIGNTLSSKNIELLNAGLFGVCQKPIYEATTNAVYLLRERITGNTEHSEQLAWHIVTAKNLGKYVSVMEETKFNFGLNEKS